jgi:hypothetical protein
LLYGRYKMYQPMGFWSRLKKKWKKARRAKVGDWMKKNKKWLVAAGLVVGAAGATIVFPGVGGMAAAAAAKMLKGIGKTLGKSASAVGALVKSGALKIYPKEGGGYGFEYGGQTGGVDYSVGSGGGAAPVKKGCFIATQSYGMAPNAFYHLRACMPDSMIRFYYKHSPLACKIVPRFIALSLLEPIRVLFTGWRTYEKDLRGDMRCL